ncbi:MAG: bifunctional diguanylate cyclase/phosphodiesterase [Quadrisphaera sp.]
MNAVRSASRWRGPGVLALPDAVWRTRHRWVCAVLLVHLPVLAVWAAVRGVPPALGATLAVPTALYLLAVVEPLSRGRVHLPRALASSAAAAGLMACSSYLVAVSDGYIEAHFHFFVMVPVVALYEDWAPFLVAVTWVVLEHGLVGTLWPHHVYGHSAEHTTHPWLFALVHGGFFTAACLGSLTAWTLSERARSVQQGLVEELSFRSRHDELTGLANRSGLGEALQAALFGEQPVAVLLLDLNGFKQVNDSLGHSVGDELLRTVASRAQSCIPVPGVVARLGGDEFVVLLPGHDVERALVQAHRLREAIARPLSLNGVTVSTTASIGVAARSRQHCPEAGRSRSEAADQLLREADVAMYQAKSNDLGTSVYEAAFDAHTAARLTELDDFRRALASDDQIVVHLQPKVSLATGALEGAEALARWRHPTRGLVPPSEFLALATSHDFCQAFTERVLDAALAQCAAWLREGYRVPVSVNITASSLLRRAFPLDVRAALTRHGVPSELLCLEITEDALVTDPALAAEVLQTLREQGVRTSVDDFGTGFSSLSYLRQLPFDELKIDRSFVLGLFPQGADGPVDEVLVASIVELGRRLGVHVVAEGVEHPHERSVLERLGCDTVQGYLHSAPVSAADFPRDLLETVRVTDSTRVEA